MIFVGKMAALKRNTELDGTVCPGNGVGFYVDNQQSVALSGRKDEIVKLISKACDELQSYAEERLKLKLSEGCAVGVNRELKDLIRVLKKEIY